LSLCHLALALGCASLSFAALAGLTIVPMILSAIGLTVAATSLVLGERSGLRTACTGVGSFACAVALVVAGLKFGGPKAVPPSPEEIAAKQSVTFPDGRKLARTPRTDDWLDANKNAVEVNGLYVGVAAVSRGRVEFRLNGKPQPSPEGQCLIVHLRAIPAERIPKEVRFAPWSEGAPQAGEAAALTDSGGNKVSLVATPAGATVAKHPRHTEFFPEMYIEDVLVFPAPEAEGDLKLTVPAEALGGVGPIRFVIPGGRIAAK
jgi:hypothetical protein